MRRRTWYGTGSIVYDRRRQCWLALRSDARANSDPRATEASGMRPHVQCPHHSQSLGLAHISPLPSALFNIRPDSRLPAAFSAVVAFVSACRCRVLRFPSHRRNPDVFPHFCSPSTVRRTDEKGRTLPVSVSPLQSGEWIPVGRSQEAARWLVFRRHVMRHMRRGRYRVPVKTTATT